MSIRQSAFDRYQAHRARRLRFESLQTRRLLAADTITGIEPVGADQLLLPAVQQISSYSVSGSSFVMADAVRIGSAKDADAFDRGYLTPHLTGESVDQVFAESVRSQIMLDSNGEIHFWKEPDQVMIEGDLMGDDLT